MKFSEFVSLYKPEIMLENYHRRTLEWLDQLDFAEIEKRMLASQIREPGKSFLEQLVLGVDFATPGYGDLTSVCIGRKIWMEKGEVQMMIIDDIYTEPVRIKGIGVQGPFSNPGLIDELLAMEARLPPLAQDEPEPRAKNGALASKKTERAKAKLAFYQGKRRF
jgi:hypothetical protein